MPGAAQSAMLFAAAMTGGAALIIGGIGLVIYLRTRRFLARASAITGTVIGLESRHGSRGGTVYHPVVQFMLPDGSQSVVVDGWGSRPPRYRAGDTVPVRYDPATQSSARVVTGLSTWFLPGMLMGVGGLLLIFGLAFLAVALFVPLPTR